ncbi:Uncharacterized protein TCM_009449 [Theobroma cacao]|uniref:Uncharacterized protein n=1 Tax=Theobroma cacao TaxID=3641 RepID=A0A061E6Q7_THECC|nr:Uncharacterized protein TCM_009449 [Theobroma cacao]
MFTPEKSHGRSKGTRCTQNAEPSYTYTGEQNVGIKDDHPIKGGVTFKDLAIGLLSLAHEFADFHNRSEAPSEEWVDSSSQDLDYVP